MATNEHLLDDAALLRLFRRRPDEAWEIFLERYADLMLTTLRHLGFDHDEAMDRFVFVCEKLCERGYRRFASVRHLGDDGELVPWLRAVVRNLSISWAWSRHGRRRLFASVADLPTYEQRVFEHYFWSGRTPSEVAEALEGEGIGRGLLAVFEALETIFEHLDAGQRWRLVSRLARHTQPLAVVDGLREPAESKRADPQRETLATERRRAVEAAVAELPARERLILRLRFEDTLGLAEVADVVHVSRSTVKASLRRSLDLLRRRLQDFESTLDQPALTTRGLSWIAFI